MKRRFGTLTGASVVAAIVILIVSACAKPPLGPADPVPILTGDPVSGGTLNAIQISEPRSMDPAVLTPGAVNQGLVGNALYGALLASNIEGTEIHPEMALELSTDDSGQTFVLRLRPGLEFTDGTPLNAQAVVTNWNRIRDPEVGSAAIRQAAIIDEMQTPDDTTVIITMKTPTPSFPQAVVNTSLNWIASPDALGRGSEAYSADPVGAGPFKLKEWARQDKIELVRNPDFWDAPKPYLDAIEVRTMSDVNQRVNAVTTGGVDLAAESNWSGLFRLQHAGFPTMTVPMGGGQFMAMNFRHAPFDDIRARRAVSQAIDLDFVNLAVYSGHGVVPRTLFTKDSPYHTDTPLSRQDAAEAQRLFDELAAEGKPVKFTYTAFPTAEDKASAESIQSQLSAFDNVEVDVELVDFPTGLQRQRNNEFDMMISSAQVQEPDYGLWTPFYSESSGNKTGINSPELDAALRAGRVARTEEERKAAYLDAQEQLVDQVVGIWYTRSGSSTVVGTNVGGVQLYGLGSVLPEEIWMQND
jgi:peptide/nickel transport system substrate-binding protein